MINSTHYPLIFCAPLESHVSAPSFCSCYEPGLNQCANKLTLQVDQQQLLAPKGNNQLQPRVQMAALHELARRGFPRSSPPEFYRVSWHEAGNYLRYEIVYSNIQYLCAVCHLLESKQKQKKQRRVSFGESATISDQLILLGSRLTEGISALRLWEVMQRLCPATSSLPGSCVTWPPNVASRRSLMS